MKKSFAGLTIILSFLFVSNLFSQTILSGKFGANFESSNYTLNKGEGKRTYSIEVKFEKPFETTPEIILSVNILDADGGKKKVAFKVDSKAVSRDGFVIEITTWGDSKINNIQGNWLAHTM